jgi:ketosteroid isomerase-like protein
MCRAETVRDEAGAIVEVAIKPGEAFDVFTRETSAWWRGDRSLTTHTGPLRFEGTRVLAEDGTEVGRVRVWEPGPRLVFSYGGGRAEVEVRFEEVPTGTRVVLRHYGWDNAEPGPWASVLAGFARHSLERVLLGRIGDFLDAIGNRDTAFFERNLTDDALLIFPGGTYTKQQCVAEMGDHAPYVKYDIQDSHVVHIAESTAVISHRASIMHTGNPAPRSIVVTSVLVREGDSWLMALNQWTPADDDQ